MERIIERANEYNSINNRLVWIDWMKTIAMYFIIVGHMFLPGNEYIYVFSVPCFFIISGFLSKREEDVNVFWKKTWWNLVVPMFLLFFIKHTEYFAKLLHAGTFQLSYFWEAPLLAMGGMQGEQFAAGGLVSLWFVYTLIVCKIILQYLPSKMFSCSLLFLNLTFLILAYVLKQRSILYYSSIVDVLLAMPFFSMGYILRSRKQILSEVSSSLIVCIILLGGVCVWLCGKYNEVVMLYRCDYGSNLLLCLIGGFMGSALIYGISYSLRLYLVDIANVIGGGTLIILALHPIVLHVCDSIMNYLGILDSISLFWRYIEAFFILISFIPLIVGIKRYIPLIYGKYRRN